MKKKLLAWILCLVMMAAMLPAPVARAADPICEIVGGAQYETLDAAVADIPANTPTTIRLLTNIDRNSTLAINGSKIITLDLNSYNLNINEELGTALDISQGSSLTTAGSGALNAAGEQYGVYATQSSTVAITGDVEAGSSGTGVYAYGVGVGVTVVGNVGGYIGVQSGNAASVTVTGAVTGAAYSVYATESSVVGITGAVTGDETGIRAYTNAKVAITGSVQATGPNSNGIMINSGAEVTVSGNVQGGYSGVTAWSGKVSVGGDVGSTAAAGMGVFADDGAEVTVSNDVISAGSWGVRAEDGGSISVAGDVQGQDYGISVSRGAEVFVSGDVRTVTSDGAGVNAFETGEATIDGNIQAHKAMTFGESDGAEIMPSTKVGYKTYSDGGDNPSFIWVKEALTVAGTATDDTAILQIDNKTPSARDKTWEIDVTSGTVKDDVSASDVTLTGLPEGLDYTAAKGAGNNIIITLTGVAETALTEDADITAVVKGSAVNEPDIQDSAGIALKLWYIGPGTAFVLSNEDATSGEGCLIDKLIAAGHGDDTLYEVLELLQPDFSGAITERFMKTLLSTPADSEVFDGSSSLSNFAGLNNPICVYADGRLSIQSIFGRDYHGDTGYTTTGSDLDGVGTVWATVADSSAYYIDAGSSGVIDGTTTYYKAFAIAWMPELPTVTTNAVESSGVSQSSAAIFGNVTSSGTAAVTERGFVYGTAAGPTTITGIKVTAALGTGTGPFSATLPGLAAGTTYHVRAYAISAAGTAYGEDRTFTTLSGGGGGGSSSSGGNSAASSGTQTYNADIKEGVVKTDTLPVKVDGASTGTADMDVSKTAKLFNAGNSSVVMPDIPGASAYRLAIPASALTADHQGSVLTLSTGFGSMTFPDNMLSSLTGMDGKTAGITIGQGDKSSLTDTEKAAIGNRPIIQLTLTLDGVQTEWNNPAAPVTVTIPYTPTAEELKNPESILVWYLDGSGKPVCVPNGHYDPATGTVTFNTTHFSRYAVGYNHVSFKDVASGAWYFKAVSFIAAREITSGTGRGKYSPDAKLTRAEFLVLLMRAYGIAPDTNPRDNFADAGNAYYTSYLAAAKRLGISAGVGNNMYRPGKEITRQEMFTLLYNALNVIGRLPQGNSGKTLSDFSDAGSIATWARDAMKRLVETGIVSGSGGKLFPMNNTTRAEMAQVLYSLLMKA